MITTLTLNPSIDRTVMLEVLMVGEVQRVLETTHEAAGKGVNIARGHGTNGRPVNAVFAVEASAEGVFRGELEPLGVTCQIVERAERTRSNLSIIERDGTTTKLNEAGASLKPEVLDALLDLAAGGEPSGYVAAAGSLPADAPVGCYVDLANRLASPNQSLAIDTSGAALASMVGVPCAVAKPNLEELKTLVATPLQTMGDVIDAATDLRAGGWSEVLVSLGSAGAVLVEESGVHHGRSKVTAVRNTVGAGDALLAGYLAGRDGGDGPSASLAEALAWAHAAVSSPGTGAPPITDRDRSTVALSPSIEAESELGEDL